MKSEYLRALILFGVLAVIAGIVYIFDPSFSKGLFVGLGIAAVIYVIRQFLPKREV